MPGSRRRGVGSHCQCGVAGSLEFDILKTHPALGQRKLAFVKCLFGTKESGCLDSDEHWIDRVKVVALALSEQGWPEPGLHAAQRLDIDSGGLDRIRCPNDPRTQLLAMRETAVSVGGPNGATIIRATHRFGNERQGFSQRGCQ